jgi:hypothetical protein
MNVSPIRATRPAPLILLGLVTLENKVISPFLVSHLLKYVIETYDM